MHDRAEVAALHPWNSALTVDQELAREFEVRLVESSTLAVRVAYSVLRNREDAEDVAQEAFAKAYRSFRQLRDRERFRAWLVRMTWRMALDRQRSNRRRVAREDHADGWLPPSGGSSTQPASHLEAASAPSISGVRSTASLKSFVL
jgi:RNA polymerase sigma factor (sigma-70 family)